MIERDLLPLETAIPEDALACLDRLIMHGTGRAIVSSFWHIVCYFFPCARDEAMTRLVFLATFSCS